MDFLREKKQQLQQNKTNKISKLPDFVYKCKLKPSINIVMFFCKNVHIFL
jgi:hypothetical protein